MVRKGNQQKQGVNRKTNNHRHTAPEPVDVSLSEEKGRSKAHNHKIVDGDIPNGVNLCESGSTPGENVTDTNYAGSDRRNKQKSCNVSHIEKSDDGTHRSAQVTDVLSNVRGAAGNDIFPDASESRGNDENLVGNDHSPCNCMANGLSMETMVGHLRSSVAEAGQSLRELALDLLNTASGWLEKQKPRLSTLTAHMCNARNYILVQVEHVYPIIWTWILHFGKLIFLLSMVWLDCNLRGLNSLLRLGTTSFFTVLWCSVLSIIAMVGMTKVLIIMAVAAVVVAFIGLALGILLIAIFAIVILWVYGSFWMTTLFVFIGGSAFVLSHERVALLVTTIYSVHCARSYMGWLGLLLGLNLSFISSDVLIYFLKNTVNEHGSDYPPEQDRQNQSGAGHFYAEPFHSSSAEDASASRRSGVPSTSGCEAELTSEDEVVRLLNCNDHYSALGFTRFESIDVSLLKREYRKKAMLVHPDKNMGNEKAAEAFKKLQNAYEVLLDTLKRKTYDDELRREELLNYFRRFQSASQKNMKHNIFSSGFTQYEPEDEGAQGESRRIACKKCGDFHKWILTQRSKSQARRCQECNDFHQAKDGDGWLEQSFHPFLFGLLHKVDAPHAYVCAESRIYDATEWFICQGMRCPANTHKPSFHVNTSLSSKHNSSTKGTSSHHRGSGGMPSANIDETMTEEEFFEWLQNAMQSGAFEAGGATTNDSPSAKSSSSSSSSKSSSVKKKRKGKKQW